MSETNQQGPMMEGQQTKRDRELRERQKQMASNFNATRESIPDHIVLMVIVFDTQSGNCQVQGPIAHKHMSYKMLELAKEAISKDSNGGSLIGSAERPMEGTEIVVLSWDTQTKLLNVAGSCDKADAYGMLESARDAIYDYNKENIQGVVKF